MDLLTLNPWWKNGRVPAFFLGRTRRLFNEALSYLEIRQILLITGLRRVGKTTLMHQLIEYLLKQRVSPYQILYFSFDELRWEMDALLKEFAFDIYQGDLQDKELYVFFDEIQKLPNWDTHIKLLYDQYPRMKIVVSGSAQITMWRGSRESLAGRFFDLRVEPLEFDEYLEFKEIDIDRHREKIFEGEIRKHFADYLRCGGFVETLDFNESMLRKYIRESLLERVIFVDMPQSFGINAPELLFKLLEINASLPGLYLDYKNLANDLGADQRTMSNYVVSLETALLCQKLYNFSSNLLTCEKKIKRLYLSNTAFTAALEPRVDFALLVEQYFVNRLHGRFFWRDPQKREVDLISTKNDVILPIEVKIKKNVDKRDLRGMFQFMERYHLNRGLLITLGKEDVYEKNGKTITALPYWRHWTLKREIQKEPKETS
ncbi:MAG: ATP-binding protein [Desulfovermiculus sp.]|nr:ATP-binding protein [Desulfovermiculus sp.]